MKHLLLLSFLCVAIRLMGQSSDKLVIKPINDHLFVYTTYHTYEGNKVSANGTCLLTKDGAVLIDTPWDTTQCLPLLTYIKEEHQCDVTLVIATHWHEDRAGALDFFNRRDIKTYTSKYTDQFLKGYDLPRPTNYFVNDTTFSVGEYIFETHYPGPGHSKDNILIWFGQDKVLHGGCFVKATTATDLGYLGDADVEQWKLGLTALLKKYKGVKKVVNGHGPWGDIKAVPHTLRLTIKELKK